MSGRREGGVNSQPQGQGPIQGQEGWLDNLCSRGGGTPGPPHQNSGMVWVTNFSPGAKHRVEKNCFPNRQKNVPLSTFWAKSCQNFQKRSEASEGEL